jgi:hypothetical protein
MRESDDLFQLVKSLSKSEKGYFKKFVKLHSGSGETNYLKLFESIDKQSTYDEKKIIAANSGELWVKQLTVTKNYLYNLILRCLELYEADGPVNTRLQKIFSQLEILFRKGLFQQCYKLLRKAEEIAVQHERFAFLLHIYEWKGRLRSATGNIEEFEKHLESGQFRQKEIIGKLSVLLEYRTLSDRMFLTRRNAGEPRQDLQTERYREIMNHPLLRNEHSASSFLSKLIFFNLNSLYRKIMREDEKCYEYRKKGFDLVDSNPGIVSARDYIASLSNLLIILNRLGRHEEFDLYFKKLKNYRPGNRAMEYLLFESRYSVELNNLFRKGEFYQALDNLPAIEEGLLKYGENLNREIRCILHYQVFYTYFANGDLSNALKWNNELLQNPDFAGLREDIRCMARITNLIIHYELGNLELLHYLLISAYRYLYHKKRLFRLESILLGFLRKLTNVKAGCDLLPLFEETGKQLEALYTDPQEKDMLQEFDFISWIRSRTQNRPFAETVRERITESSASL